MKEDPTQGKKPKFLGKAGWVKKASGKLLVNYKERFVHVEKTEIVVYENEVRNIKNYLSSKIVLMTDANVPFSVCLGLAEMFRKT